MDQTFDLFDRLGANDDQMDFPIVYASALQGFATLDPATPSDTMDPLFQTIVERVSQPDVDRNGPLQLQVSALDYSSYTGVIGIGRIRRGKLAKKPAGRHRRRGRQDPQGQGVAGIRLPRP